MKVLDLEKKLSPDCFKLKIDSEGYISSTIIDVELDPIQVSFGNDDCVDINTDGLSYIILSERHLMNLIDMIRKAKIMHQKNEDTNI
jgi:hypothetical protein